MVLLLSIAGIFMVTVAMVWLALFPTGRDAVSGAAVATGFRASTCAQQWSRGLTAVVGAIRVRMRRALASGAQYASHNRRLVAGMTLLVCLPPLVVAQMYHGFGPESAGFESGAIDQALISRLMRSGHPGLPPPLDAAMFSTHELQLIRPNLAAANRDWSRLQPEFRQRLLVVYKLMRKKYGYNMIMIEGYRSPQRQTMLAKRKPGVTGAGAFESYHQYGLAADSAFLRHGEIVISPESDWALRGYRLYGRLAEAVGLTWGGDRTLHDYGHVELRRPGVVP